jgi:hypothetical protein
MRGIRDSVVERYSEQAHFVYELLQNADDVLATKVRFVLRKDGFYFIHNGQIPFTVTPPNVSPAGHINAITSIGASSKKDENYKIGKFGIGFKSVFQYTQTPHIYDENVAFRIRDLIVPELLEEQSHPLREKGETLFYFPFNLENKSPKQAQQEIQNRLEALQFPLLFLNHLQEIIWETDETSGFYKLESTGVGRFQNVRRLNSIKKVDSQIKTTKFVQLSEKEPITKLSYSIVFKLDEQGQIDYKNTFVAHCYFPTRVQTPFHFLIHAPFLLTDSREGIKLEDDWNKKLIELLAKLLLGKIDNLKSQKLINEAFFQVLPIDEKAFVGETGQFFYPFIQTIYQFFSKTNVECLPTESNELVSFEKALFAESQSLRQLLNNTQLEDLTNVKGVKWIFPNLPSHSKLGLFIKKMLLERAQVEEQYQPVWNWETALRQMNVDFFNKQSDEWLTRLYNEIYLHHRGLWEKTIKTNIPLIRLESGKMVIAFDAQTGKPNAYLPTNVSSNYPTIKQSLLKNKNTELLFENLGLTSPELRLELNQFILPKYKRRRRTIPKIEDLEKLFLHYEQCNVEEAEMFLKEISELPILQAVKSSDGSIVGAVPREVYLENDDLISLDGLYNEILKRIDKARFQKFLIKLGVKTLPQFLQTDDTLSESERKKLIQRQNANANFAMWEEVEDVSLDGLEYFLEEMNAEKSHFLWSFFKKIFVRKTPITTGIFKYEYEEEHIEEIEAHWLRLLRQKAWILDREGFLMKAENIRAEWLATIYPEANDHPLVELLFEKKSIEERLELLTPDERMAMELGQRLLQQGLTVSDLEQFKTWKQVKEEETEKEQRPKKQRKKREQQDVDEFNPAFLSSEELIEKKEELRQKMQADLAEQLDILEKIEFLKQIITESQRYSFIWYKALLELEYILALEQIGKDRSFRIDFKTITQEKGTAKTILLKEPSKDIPYTIEMMGDMTLKIQLEEERRTLAVEVVSIRHGALRAKLKSPEELDGIDLKKAKGGILEIKNTIFTLEALVNAFKELPFEDDDNLQELLPSNIRFVFGPPGTGKTTHIANQEILPMMLGERAMRILVLTPTNKSADVLARKILSLVADPPRWLIRFGSSGDDVVENAGLLCDNTLEIDDYEACCVITTATRFPYDGFNSGKEEAQLKNLDWDIIIVDEASMIALPMITYMLHQLPKTEFIITGDPFQIEPIAHAEEWKNENIYSLVNLNSFDPKVQVENILPNQYEVLNLTEQYRSVPTIGHVFSAFAYDSRLSHFKKKEEQRNLKLDNLELKPVNIIRFPAHLLETLYRPQKLNSSHYHIYSALLTAELVKYLVEQIFKNHIENQSKSKKWRIGIICPYKAQAQLVDKTIAAQHLSKPKIAVHCGTIHSFQGDECDIMINLFNPPLYISKSPNMFLNRRNIVNVAISRAKDYLILLIPDKNTDKVWNLVELGRMLDIIRNDLKGHYWEKSSAEIEELLFKQSNYLEMNTFATTHQNINVYTEPEKQFEIRVEEMAIDVQIKRNGK